MVQQIDVRELATRLAAQELIYLLDVRQPWENETAALPNSVLIPLHELPARATEIDTAPGMLLVAYCHHGIRSLQAAAFLERLGFTNVASLAGGIDAWSREMDPNLPRY